jgi:hypothetical protein
MSVSFAVNAKVKETRAHYFRLQLFNIPYYGYNCVYNYTLTVTVFFVSIAYFMTIEYSDTLFPNFCLLVFNVLVYCNNLLFDIGKVQPESHFRQL